jgi:4-amino-4-deoxy-L-arabinose transferase-like glycosyltransferase
MQRQTGKHLYLHTPLILVVIVPLICLVPFIGNAFHIDATVYIWVAKHIHTNPFDFYGFKANWHGLPQSMSFINKNPPLVSYYIALVAALFGWAELTLHLAFLLVAVGFSLGTYYLARSFCQHPHIATLMAVLTPVFLLSSTNVMADTMMLAFYVWAVALWVRGLEENRSLYLLIASILIALSALTKYFGMTLVPLLIMYSLVLKRRLGSWILFLCIPILVLCSYQWLTYALYGQDLITSAVLFSLGWELSEKLKLPTKTLIGLAFAGGSIVSVAFYAPFLWSRRFWLIIIILLALVVAVLVSMGTVGTLSLRDANIIRWELLLQLALFIVAGIHILTLATADLWKNRDASSWLLFMWILGTFVFSSYVNWTTNARSIYPMVPAVVIVAMRRFEQRSEATALKLNWKVYWPLIPAALIAILVTWADATFAECQRTAARQIHTKFQGYPGKLWFQGHWGFQYYMEAHGAEAQDKLTPIMPGDILVIPQNNTNLISISENSFVRIGKIQLMTFRWLGTMQSSIGAGFYDGSMGPLPFAFGSVKPEEYLLLVAQ